MVYYQNRIHDKNFKPFEDLEEEEEETNAKTHPKQEKM